MRFDWLFIPAHTQGSVFQFIADETHCRVNKRRRRTRHECGSSRGGAYSAGKGLERARGPTWASELISGNLVSLGHRDVGGIIQRQAR